ncbi:MAG: type II toxin-antitoxin system YoeB family toxin [Deltaproteobacteria bacterium]|nr:type II toxin-antitoxin system YoeB family toxin [Candidatus Desulfobacula maris]MBL6996055.1 type II toxin-antitoxin system YoeB family toxin [Desulfobacula sp.]
MGIKSLFPTNRLVYAVDDDFITIISCKYHY